MKLVQTTFLPVSAITPWPTAAKLFPRYSEREMDDLNEFVQRHGETAVVPVVVSPDYLLVDGYNRYQGAVQRGDEMIQAQVYMYNSEEEMEIHAICLNAKRRHLEPIVAARAASRLAEIYRPKPEETKQKLSEAGKAGGRGKEKASTTPVDKPFRQERAIEKASREIGVSPNTVRAVAKVDATKDEDLIQAMEKKEISIEKAAKVAEMEPQERKAILEVCRQAGDQVQKACDGMVAALSKRNQAEMIGAACIDCIIRLNQAWDRSEVEKFKPTPQELEMIYKAVGGVAGKIAEMHQKITSMMEAK